MIVAMHISDGIVNAPTSLLFAAVAALAVAGCAWRARSELDERAVPLAGLVTAFVFAAQMVNFPILPGVSGHLLGGALAATLVGPFTGALCLTIVLVVQALLFADGGITALGCNITNMALVGVAAGYATALLGRRLAGRRVARVAVLGAIGFGAAVAATLCAAAAFLVEYAIGGAAPDSLGAVAGYLLGTHLLIGVGEGVITALTVMAVARLRPDLIWLLSDRRSPAAVAA